ncbi:MAG: hypothetical protein R2880_19005 [Deinococcales bacterium]
MRFKLTEAQHESLSQRLATLSDNGVLTSLLLKAVTAETLKRFEEELA